MEGGGGCQVTTYANVPLVLHCFHHQHNNENEDDTINDVGYDKYVNVDSPYPSFPHFNFNYDMYSYMIYYVIILFSTVSTQQHHNNENEDDTMYSYMIYYMIDHLVLPVSTPTQ